MAKEIYEKLGLFYMGRDVDEESMQTTEALTLLKNKNFTTHAAIIGMTGSGKTGLGIGLIEEAAMDNIPSIVIDPKGDMGDLCLTDPTFSAESFTPWVKDEALAKGEEPSVYAKKISQEWKSGIESWGQDAQRVERFASVPKTIYTPGSSAGVSINILASLEAPPSEVMDDSDTLASFLKSTVSSLLSLIGIEADPINSKEYIILAQIILEGWSDGKNISIEELIGSIINPPFKKVGVLPLDSYYPQAERFKFATKFNAVIASPSFSSWLEGENLDIQKLLYDEDGKAKIAIFSIAHLSDNERMFFVTLLLNKYIAWMRHQSGTTSLKTILYMDEIYGFFPPTKNPPSKEPMLLLLKQARAYGVGVVLSTQNPVDLDYKGLSNIGTWFIGRLQTSQDIDRIIDGLDGKVGSNFDRAQIKKILSSMPKRTFLLKSAHLDDIRLFATRWVMSYLKGPLKKSDISALMAKQKGEASEDIPIEPASSNDEEYESYNTLNNSITQYYEIDSRGENRYTPTIAAKVEVSFFNQTRGIDEKEIQMIEVALESSHKDIDWSSAERLERDFSRLPTQKPSEAKLKRLPDFIHQDRGLRETKKSLEDWLYQEKRLVLFRCKSPKLESKPYETLGDFKVRLQDILNEKKDIEIDKLKERYGKKEQTLQDRLNRALERVEKEESDVNSKTTDTMISAGMAVIGALFGSKSTAKIGTTLSKGSRILKERGDVDRANKRVQEIQEKLDDLADELDEKVDQLEEKYDIDSCDIDDFSIKPRRSDIVVDEVALVWRVE
ncbi:FIG00495827: hypothetical protein [hydrothermal vent metagenome]|uniref:Helicase HerA central domain-containing protein n=1 Tax=hydrothermal vent metagenome TaxID=652676 RepID=A0A1W1BLD7_9ZZZZ